MPLKNKMCRRLGTLDVTPTPLLLLTQVSSPGLWKAPAYSQPHDSSGGANLKKSMGKKLFRFAQPFLAEATNDVTDYIVGFHSSVRLYVKLSKMSPAVIEHESTSRKSIEPSEIT